MDRINTWLRRAILCFVLVWSFPAGAGSPEVERIAKEAARHADHTKIVIVGVAHDNERLADELLELLTLLRANDEFDCFFVELPTDLQDEFDGAVNGGDVNRLVQAFYLSRKPPFLLASRKLGYESEAHQAYLSSWLDRAIKEASSERLGVNKKLLTYLKENRIPLLPYDADFAITGNV